MKKQLRIPLLSMSVAILLIVAFQGWWLAKSYKDERKELHIRSNILFRESIWQLQASKLDLDSGIHFRFPRRGDVLTLMNKMRVRSKRDSSRSDTINIVKEATDKRSAVIIRMSSSDSGMDMPPPPRRPDAYFFEMMAGMDSLQRPITIAEIRERYDRSLKKQGLDIEYSISSDTIHVNDDNNTQSFERNVVIVGLKRPVAYRLDLQHENAFLLQKLGSQIFFSLFLVGMTLLSFFLLYRNLLQQQRLTELKNDLINNITHELKTPIATVSVAIEALKNFNAMQDPQRSHEYLDISSNELNRLSMLVDKVLKFSMFEKKELELKKEPIALNDVVNEVVRSLQPQFERQHAHVEVSTSGTDLTMDADRSHITSVVYNLIDNALKYSKEEPRIDVHIADAGQTVTLSVADNGIGIPAGYMNRIFEKFFRVPHGDTHNIKGHGLGLSYVAQVVKEHGGTIEVKSEEGKGSTFIVRLPRH